jgi:NADH:ubiquinone oxidoreductase subunit 5 (subunit L)/multisubunit Na+/H+ antiporter MnhA subunit
MSLSSVIQLFVLIPLAGFIISLFPVERAERLLSRTAILTSVLNLLGLICFTPVWIFKKHPVLSLKELTLFSDNQYEFSICFYFDKISALYLLVGALLTFLITIYSQYYLHREEGYKRFFNTILFFYTGYSVTVLSGNFETLFAGWEILGISSFLLIAFYRERYLPARNAVKVFSIYRIGDVGILLAIWAGHYLWQENITFAKLSDYATVQKLVKDHLVVALFISTMLVVAAAAKSAQLPFSSWLPRAMEGPTPSSAIFYGSLSVHIGVFLLLRTHPFWEHLWSIKALIICTGLSTSLIATGISRVQSSIKTQIAYASVAQIGIIFTEIALGLENIALLHFAGNAFLRTYQLLISPSVITYLIREQFYNYKAPAYTKQNSIIARIRYKFYLLNIKEWNLDKITNNLIFTPLKRLGQKLDFLTYRNVLYFVIPSYIFCFSLFMTGKQIPAGIRSFFPYVFSFIGLIMVLKSFSERKDPRLAWLLVIFNHLWIVLAISFNETYGFVQFLIYLLGIAVSGAVGFACIQKLKKSEPAYSDLNQYYGHVYEYPVLSFVFLLSALGLMGFPITMTFIGEDILYSHIRENQFLLALFAALSFIMGGVALIRIYARLFLGPHVKTYHGTSIREA